MTLWKAAARGALAGAVGVGAMTVTEKLEQARTGRPSSYVPARTLLALVGRRPPQGARPTVWNHVMHWGTGALVGSLRGVWSVVGMRGRVIDGVHLVTRLAFDQTLENATGVGSPPSRWPRSELVLDVAHKAVYAFVTGFVADRWIAPALEGVHGDELGRRRAARGTGDRTATAAAGRA
jgi:hypothetical protein